MLKVPLKKDMLHSSINYEKLIRMQSENFYETICQNLNQKPMVKVKTNNPNVFRIPRNYEGEVHD